MYSFSQGSRKETKYNNFDVSKYKKINSKTGVSLYKKNETNTDEYYLRFTIENSKYDLKQLIKTSMITMLKQFNKELLEDFVMNNNITNDGGSMDIYLHSPNKDMGISKKFIKTNFSLIENNSIMVVNAESNSHNEDVIHYNNNKYEKITLKSFEAEIDCSDIHSCKFTISFNIDIHEELPIYMINMRGILIAKICDNLKKFIEQM